MKIKRSAVAGTMESSDIMVTVAPNNGGIQIELNSTVEKQFGQEIRNVIQDTLTRLGIDSVTVTAVDKGALDCVGRARVETAAYRACGSENYVDYDVWGGMMI